MCKTDTEHNVRTHVYEIFFFFYFMEDGIKLFFFKYQFYEKMDQI